MSVEQPLSHPTSPAPNPNAPLLSFRIRADFGQVREAVSTIRTSLEALHLSEEELVSVELVVAEALNNIVDHAYPPNSDGEIRIKLRQRPRGVMVEIRDDGTPMPNGRAPLGDHPLTDKLGTNDLPEGGFGWFLIREIARDLIYDRKDGENFLIFRLAVGTG